MPKGKEHQYRATCEQPVGMARLTEYHYTRSFAKLAIIEELNLPVRTFSGTNYITPGPVSGNHGFAFWSATVEA
jgi:hypothetical protein